MIAKEIENKLNELFAKINPDNVDEWFDDVKKTVDIFLLGEKLFDLSKALEKIVDDISGDKRWKVDSLIKRIQQSEPDFLIERLKRRGGGIVANDKTLSEAIQKESLKILEQARLGKRDAVIGMLLRIFVVNNKRFPDELIEVVKPKHDINLFRAFIYSFLSSFSRPKEGKDEE